MSDDQPPSQEELVQARRLAQVVDGEDVAPATPDEEDLFATAQGIRAGAGDLEPRLAELAARLTAGSRAGAAPPSRGLRLARRVTALAAAFALGILAGREAAPLDRGHAGPGPSPLPPATRQPLWAGLPTLAALPSPWKHRRPWGGAASPARTALARAGRAEPRKP